jgi:cysteine synthase A
MRFSSIIDTIGNTPLVLLKKLSPSGHASVWAKLESFNPLGCIKERPAYYMIESAEKANLIEPNKTIIVEPTSGNTGIGLAMVCAVKGYDLIVTAPEGMSLEKRMIMQQLGATVVSTKRELGAQGTIAMAEKILSKGEPYTFLPNQFKNIANIIAHRETTAIEILQDMSDLSIDAFVSGVGTGGTISGTGQVLRENLGNSIKIVAVEPAGSPVLSGGISGGHKIEGLGAGARISMINANGQIVSKMNSTGTNMEYNLGNLKSGIYLMKVEQDGKAFLSKFIKQ